MKVLGFPLFFFNFLLFQNLVLKVYEIEDLFFYLLISHANPQPHIKIVAPHSPLARFWLDLLWNAGQIIWGNSNFLPAEFQITFLKMNQSPHIVRNQTNLSVMAIFIKSCDSAGALGFCFINTWNISKHMWIIHGKLQALSFPPSGHLLLVWAWVIHSETRFLQTYINWKVKTMNVF